METLREKYSTMNPEVVDNISGYTYGMMQEILTEMLQDLIDHNTSKTEIDKINSRLDGIAERTEELEQIWLDDDGEQHDAMHEHERTTTV